jgi:hypothetical protein
MLETINAIDGCNTPWQSFSASYSGDKPPNNIPDWMLKDYTVVRKMDFPPSFFDHFSLSFVY